MQLDLTIHVSREGTQYIAHALPLDVISSGPTPDQAQDAVDEAVRCFIHTAADAGTLDQVLEDCGYQRSNGSWIAPEWLGAECRAVAV